MSKKGSSKYDKETITNLYLDKNLTCPQIADQLGLKLSHLKAFIDNNNIRKRTKREPNRKIVENLYIEKDLSGTQVASNLGISINILKKYLAKNNIRKSK